MKPVMHVFFGDASYHPIIQSYLSFYPNSFYVHAPKLGSRTSRIVKLFRELYKKRIAYSGYIQCHDPISFLIALIFFKRKQIILDAHEVFSTFISNKSMYYLGFKIEKMMFRIANKKIFPSNDRAKIFFKEPENEPGLYIVENLLNDNLIPKDTGGEIEQLDLYKDKVNCIYVGTFTDKRAVSEIISAIEKLNDVDKKYFLHLYGEKTEYLTSCLVNASQCIVYHGVVPREELLSIYEKFDISFALYKPVDLNNKYCAPTKIFENEYYSLRTVCNNSPYLRSLSDAGRIESPILINEITPEGIADAIRSNPIKKNYDKEIVMSERETLALNKKLLWSSQINVIKRIYQ